GGGGGGGAGVHRGAVRRRHLGGIRAAGRATTGPDGGLRGGAIMRVLFNALPTMQPGTEIGRYSAELLRSLTELEPGSVRAYPANLDRLMIRLLHKQPPP